jgi:hypothetical protein
MNPITIDKAMQVALFASEQAAALAAGDWADDVEEARLELMELYRIIEVLGAEITTLRSASQTLAATNITLRDSHDEMLRLLQARLEGEDQPEEVTGVHWQGSSSAYFDNMEAVNRELASEISKTFFKPGEGVIDLD